MLEPELRKLLASAIHIAFDVEPLKDLLYLTLDVDPEDIIPSGTTKTAAIVNTIRWAEAGSKPRMTEFLDALEGEANRADNQTLVAAVRRVRDGLVPPPVLAWYPESEPVRVVFVEAEPFLDRDDLRDHLGTLMKGQGRRILRLRGGAGSGKTWTRLLVHHLEQHTGDFVAVYVDFEDFDPLTPAAVMEAVAMKFGCELADTKDIFAQASNQNIRLVNWLKRTLRERAPVGLWLMFDHSLKAPPGDRVQKLIKLLIREMRHGELHSLRLLFLDWERDLPQPLEEEIRPLQKRDVQRALSRIATEGGHGVESAQLTQEVDAVTEGLGEHFLPGQVFDRLLPACERLFAPVDDGDGP